MPAKLIHHRIADRADSHGDAAGHAPLSGTAERRSSQPLDGQVQLGIGHDDQVVLRPAGRLHALAVVGRRFVHVPGNRCRADKRDCGDQRVSQQCVDTFPVAVHDVEHTGRQACFGQQFAEPNGGKRHLFRRFEHKRVAAHQRDRNHPHRHHQREVVRRDAHAHTDGMPCHLGIDVAGDVRQDAAHQQAGNAAGKLGHFHPALHLGPRFGERFAVLASDQRRQLFELLLHEFTEAKHDAGTFHNGSGAPGGQGSVSRLDDLARLFSRAERHACDDLPGRRVVNVVKSRGASGQPFSGPQPRHGVCLCCRLFHGRLGLRAVVKSSDGREAKSSAYVPGWRS